MARLPTKPDAFQPGDRVSAGALNRILAATPRELVGGDGLNIEQFGDRYQISQERQFRAYLPDITNYLAWFTVLQEYDDYLLCTPQQVDVDGTGNWTTYKYDPTRGTLPPDLPKLYVAKPYELQKIAWNGVSIAMSVNGAAIATYYYVYSNVAVGQRALYNATDTLVQNETIYRDYAPGDAIQASRKVTGLYDPEGVPVLWMDNNTAARKWEAALRSAIYILVLDEIDTTQTYQGVLSVPLTLTTWQDAVAVVDVRAINGETLMAGERYLSFYVGPAADGTPAYLCVATCCSGSGSGSGDGGGVVTACCPGVTIPATLYATISGGTGSCVCMNGTYTLLYYSPLSFWLSSTSTCGTPLNLRVWCDADGGWHLYTYCADIEVNGACGNGFPVLSGTCNPFVMSGLTCGCCGDCAQQMTITVTATNHGGGGGVDCGTGNCGTGVSPTVTCTVTGATGCYTAIHGSFSMICQNDGLGGHAWIATGTMAICGHTVTPALGLENDPLGPDGGPPVLVIDLTLPSGGVAFVNSGYVCYPLVAVFDIDDGAGNACTITALGAA